MFFCAAVLLTVRFLHRGPDSASVVRDGVTSSVALSVPVEIIREGEDPALRRVEVRP